MQTCLRLQSELTRLLFSKKIGDCMQYQDSHRLWKPACSYAYLITWILRLSLGSFTLSALTQSWYALAKYLISLHVPSNKWKGETNTALTQQESKLTLAGFCVHIIGSKLWKFQKSLLFKLSNLNSTAVLNLNKAQRKLKTNAAIECEFHRADVHLS